MSIINCPECGNKISDNAKSCPHCGFGSSSKGKSGGTKGAGFKIIGAFILLVVLMNICSDEKSISNNDSVAELEATEPEPLPTIGDKLTTAYFEISLNKIWIDSKVRTGNQFTNLEQEDGSKYLIINITFKNIDTESRLFSEGSVFIDYNNVLYEFDKAEMILADGWGSFLDQLNPLLSKTTNLVYKIPSEIQGNAIWVPGRNNQEKSFFLGKI